MTFRDLTRAENIRVLRSEFPHSLHSFTSPDWPRNLGSEQKYLTPEFNGFENICETQAGTYRVELSTSDTFEGVNIIEIDVNPGKVERIRIGFAKQTDCNELKGSFIKLFGDPDGKIYGREGETSTALFQWEQPNSRVEINCYCLDVHKKNRQYWVDGVTFNPK